MLEHKTLGYFLQNVGCLCPFFNSFGLCRPFPWHTSLGVSQAKVGPVPTVARDSEGVEDLKTKCDDQRKKFEAANHEGKLIFFIYIFNKKGQTSSEPGTSNKSNPPKLNQLNSWIAQ